MIQWQRTVFLLFLGMLVIGFAYVMRSFWVAGALALVTALVLRPLHRRVERWFRQRYLAAGVTVILTGAFLILPIGAVVITIVVEIIRFSHDLTDLLQQGQLAQSLDALNAWVFDAVTPAREWFGTDWNLRQVLVQVAQKFGTALYQYSPKFVLSTASVGFHIMLWILFLFVLLADGPALYRYVMEILPVAPRHEAQISHEVRDMVIAVYVGMVATALVNGLLMGIAFAVCGIHRPWMWGLVTFGVSFIPIVGAFSIWVGAALYLAMTGAWPYAIGLTIFGLVVIAQVDNVVKPIAMRGRVKIHPVLLLLSILGGIQAMGIVGLVLGPVLVAIFLAALRIYRLEFVQGTNG